MKRSLAWFAGLVGIAALGKWLAGRTHRAQQQAPAWNPPAVDEPAPDTRRPDDDPADELRRKLAAARDTEPDELAAGVDETLDDRRARVHAQARELIETMEDGPA